MDIFLLGCGTTSTMMAHVHRRLAGPGIPWHCPGYFKPHITEPDAKTPYIA